MTNLRHIHLEFQSKHRNLLDDEVMPKGGVGGGFICDSLFFSNLSEALQDCSSCFLLN